MTSLETSFLHVQPPSHLILYHQLVNLSHILADERHEPMARHVGSLLSWETDSVMEKQAGNVCSCFSRAASHRKIGIEVAESKW